jgi:FkbM family methyltransferase
MAANCLKSSVRSLPRNEAEEQLFARCKSALAGAGEANVGVRAICAAMLSWHTFELESLPRLTTFDPELRRAWLSYLLETPPAFLRPGDGDRFARYLQQVCDLLHDYLRSVAGPVDDVAAAFCGSPVFMQSYFNELNLRELMRSRAAIVEELLRRGGARLDELRVTRAAPKRPRIGFIAWTVSDGTETAALAAHMERLDRRRFDVRLYSIGLPGGKLGAVCRASAENYIPLPDQVPAAVAWLRRENLDIAVFCTNLTAIPHVLTLIAAHRVAPVQVTTGASPVTTGLRNMDVMISGVPNEGGDAQAHYTEQVVLLPEAINCYAFDHMLEGLTPPDPISRAAHGIPADATLFFSAANFYKIQPELSDLWFRILMQVPDSYLMLMPFNPNWSNDYPVLSFNERLRAQAAAVGLDMKRIRLHPPVPTVVHLHRVIEMADVYLDAFPFSGACSIYDVLVAGVPAVARAGQVCRSRHSTAILHEAGLGDWVAPDTETYVARAVELGRDRKKRQAERDRVAEVRRAGLKVADTAPFAGMLMTMFDGLVADWNRRSERLHALAPATIAVRIADLSREVAPWIGSFADCDLVDRVVLPYLRHGGSRRLLDVGACLGSISRPFLEEGWQVVMFEPDERCQQVLSSLAEGYPGQVRVEKAAVTCAGQEKVAFHVASAPGLSGLSRSPHAEDLTVMQVSAVRLRSYIARHGLFDVDFVKIDAEGHDFEILQDIDFGMIAPRLVMVEFGEQFAGQDRGSIAAVLERMRDRGYRACVVCARALGDFSRHEWRTGLLAIGVDAVPEVPGDMPLFGNMLFFRSDDGDFLPSVLAWLEQSKDWSGRGLVALS